MKEPYYMIDFSASSCLFEIRVNDNPVLSMNIKGQAATRIPINYAISDKGKQEISIIMLPLLGDTQLLNGAEFYYNVQLFDANKSLEFKEQFNGFRSDKIDEKKPVPLIKNISFFNAEIPYQLKNIWTEGENIKDVKDYKVKLINAYRNIINIIKDGNYDLFSEKIENREYNMSTSMYLSRNESNNRINGLINDFKNGYNQVLFDENPVPIISAYGKKVALKKLNGESALAFINKEKKEQIMLDIEFYFNKQTNAFEII